jgi:hypothetical protein
MEKQLRIYARFLPGLYCPFGQKSTPVSTTALHRVQIKLLVDPILEKL